MLKPNSFLVTISVPDNYSNGQMNAGADTTLKIQQANPYYIRHKTYDDGRFELFFGERKDAKTFDFLTPVNGTSVIYTTADHALTVTSDMAGAEPLFYRSTNSGMLFSNRLENLIGTSDEPDWSGIHCYLTFGYTPGESTFFKDVFQTLSNQTIKIDTRTLSVTKHISDISEHNQATNSPENKGKQFAHQLTNIMQQYEPMALMMSAGWDSRTLLAPADSPVCLTYTHGDTSSRECTIAKRLSGAVRTDHYFKDVKSLLINNELLDIMLEKHGHCLFPIWHLSSKLISEQFYLPISGGVIGARLGGHNGFSSTGSRFNKSINSLHFFSPRLISERKIVKDFKRTLSPPQQFWFTSNKGAAIFQNSGTNLEICLHEQLDNFIVQAEDFSFGIEMFNYEHTSRQYMMKQPSMAKPFHGYYSPLSHPDLLKIVYATPFKQRLQNRLTKEVIKNLNNTLLHFPMAATLIKAKHPIVIQELSRVARIIYEKSFYRLKHNRPSLGWFNYEHLYTGDFFKTIIHSLKSDIWSKDRMLRTIASNQNNNIDAGSTMDMITKIKTIDYYLSRNSRNMAKVKEAIQ
ncbi:hypothetical protein [Marinobacter piscensis]|uniref:hypothetical protein n=1 Tax=Marinobacter piscensis TaxID=1562308 RepID=UPI00119E6681|nr:hypothetical protein [Marinobacter piscensis]